MSQSEVPTLNKLSTENKKPSLMDASLQSSITSNPTVLTYNEEINLPSGLEDKGSLYTSGKSQSPSEDQKRMPKEYTEEEKHDARLDGGDKTNHSQTLHSGNFSPTETRKNFKQHTNEPYREDPDQGDEEGHRIFGRYIEEYQKKYPNDPNYLKISKQASSPEAKKSGILAFRRICNNSLGDTLVSEFIPGPIPDKESGSKSSKSSSNENLVNFDHPEDVPLPNQTNTQTKKQPQDRALNKLMEIDSSLEAYQTENLKRSDLQALKRKRDKKLKEPAKFNIIVVGESGLGKSTFIDCFLERYENITGPIRPKTGKTCQKTGKQTYDDITFEITMIDTEGYTESCDLRQWYQGIRKEITKRFDEYKDEKKELESQKKVTDSPINDPRVHMMLYFLSGPRIKSRDIQLMKKFNKYCNIIPILAKGDSLTLQEIREIKVDLIQRAYNQKIEWFDFGQVLIALINNPEKLKELTDCRFGPCPPFLIISSVTKIKVASNKYINGREYVWGVCNIEDPNHSDFVLLRSLLGGYICWEAIETTKDYYKQYTKAQKEKSKEQSEQEATKKTITFGAFLAFGVVGGLFWAKKKFGYCDKISRRSL